MKIKTLEEGIDEFLKTHSYHKTTGWVEDKKTPIKGDWKK